MSHHPHSLDATVNTCESTARYRFTVEPVRFPRARVSRAETMCTGVISAKV
jgi:hypothetical protein